MLVTFIIFRVNIEIAEVAVMLNDHEMQLFLELTTRVQTSAGAKFILSRVFIYSSECLSRVNNLIELIT